MKKHTTNLYIHATNAIIKQQQKMILATIFTHNKRKPLKSATNVIMKQQQKTSLKSIVELYMELSKSKTN